MQTAAYTTVKTATNGEGKYPLSTQTLEFIQQQILLLQEVVAIAGGKVILKEPDGTNTGLLALDGEVLPIAATPRLTSAIKYVYVVTTKTDIEADGEVYQEARIERTAKFAPTTTNAVNVDVYPIGNFTKLTTNTTLAEKINNMPSLVLSYLSDTLASKLDRLTINNATQAQIDGLKTACVVNCTSSVSVLGFTNYCLTVKCVGTAVEQMLTTPAGANYARYYNASTKKWSDWVSVTDNMHIEVKTVGGTLYVRHGVLANDAKIIFLRKKKRSGWRSTGGDKAYTKNKNKRQKRQKKLQYVHYKGVILSKGEPGQWYVPKCIAVANEAADANLIDREVSSIAGQLVRQVAVNSNGIAVYRLAGVRKLLTKTTSGKNYKRSGYINLAVQVAKISATGGKDAGGELARFKLRLAPKKVYNSPSATKYTHVYVRTFSVE
jgi:hypothetical protein